MQLVMLAAGFGTRFGGLKQLAPVGPNEQTIMDYTAMAANRCGFDGAVVVIRPEIEEALRTHIRAHWPKGFPVEFVYQPTVRGTAPAVLAAKQFVAGPFAVTNADDLYGIGALAMIPAHFGRQDDVADRRHLLVAYRLVNTVLGDEEVKRGICELNDHEELKRIAEHTVVLRADHTFTATPIGKAADDVQRDGALEAQVLTGNEYVSMNLWGFHAGIFDYLEQSVARYASENDDSEFLLPDVIAELVGSDQSAVRVVVTEDRCIGITHRDDLAIVRAQVLAFSDN